MRIFFVFSLFDNYTHTAILSYIYYTIFNESIIIINNDQNTHHSQPNCV